MSSTLLPMPDMDSDSDQERNFLSAVLDTIDALVVVLDRNGIIVRFNHACERSTGYSFAEVRGKNYADLFLLPEEAPAVDLVVEELLSGRYPNHHQNHWTTKDGRLRLVDWSNTVLLDRTGAVEYIVATGVDITEQRQAELALRESEERYSSLFNNHHTPMLLIDPATAQIIDANPAACDFYGWSQAELRAMKITQINQLPPDQTQEKMSAAQKTDASQIFEFKHRLFDGQIRDVEVYSGPIRLANHEYLFSIIHDITRRKRIENEVKYLSRFPQENPNPVMRFTWDGEILYANKASGEVLSCWKRQVGQTAPGEIQTLIGEVIKTQENREITVECRERTYVLLFSHISNTNYINAYGSDITLRERLAKENRRQKELLDNLFQYDPGGLAVVSGADFVVRYANPAYRALTPHPEVDPNGLAITDVWPSSEGFQWQTILSRAVETGQAVYVERYASQFPDGMTRFFTFHLAHLDWEGQPAIFVVIWNTTELEEARHQAEEAAARANAFAEKVQQVNRDLQDFAYIASHDMQEPLRKIQAFGERLITHYGNSLDEEGADYIRRMTLAAGRMDTILRSLLEYSRVSTRAKPYQPVALEGIVQDVLSDLEYRIEQTGGQVHVSTLPTIEADPTQMHQLFQNLIGNALKFQSSGSIPVVKISGKILQHTARAEELAQIVVEDNGIGFEEKYLDRIFQPFQRLHGRNEYEGHGIGLAICRKIVERHHGDITARSAPGQGTAFIITLPVKAERT